MRKYNKHLILITYKSGAQIACWMDRFSKSDKSISWMEGQVGVTTEEIEQQGAEFDLKGIPIVQIVNDMGLVSSIDNISVVSVVKGSLGQRGEDDV